MNENKKTEVALNNKSNLYDLTQAAFFVVRAIGIVDWPWWKVLMPTWVLIGVIVIMAVGTLIAKGAEKVGTE